MACLVYFTKVKLFMNKNNAKKTYLKDYKPCDFEVLRIDLTFDIGEKETQVTNAMKIKALSPNAKLILDGENLKLTNVHLNGENLSADKYKSSESHLEIFDYPSEFELIIQTQINPDENKALSGLYRSDGLFCTQCEAEGFRRMTYYFDRPDVLSCYSTKIIADKKTAPILLSNGNLIEEGELENGRHFALWQDPHKKPCYLFALVAGDLAVIEDEFITMSGKKVSLKMYVEPGNESKCEHAMNSLKASMRWDEEKYGREYDLDIFMIVAVSTFNMGAMENKGLNIFNDKYVLARPELATDFDYAGIEGVIAHEYFHNWTGNRVTCRDWFQLSLKEGLTVFRDQTFSEDMNAKTVCRIQDVDILRAHQFPEDNGPTAHAVMPDSYLQIDNFYTTTIYNKGAELIRMQHALLGEKGFRQGMDLYFKRHDGQAVTIEDFVLAMEDANDKDLTQFRRWYVQAGTPRVSVDESYENETLTLTLNQHCPKTPGQDTKLPFHIPLAIKLFDSKGKSITNVSSMIELKDEKATFSFNSLKDKPTVSLLRGFSAPIILERDLSIDYLIDIARFEDDGFAKSEAVKCIVKSQIHGFKNDAAFMVSDKVIALFIDLLNEAHDDNALKALLLKTPSFEYLVAGEKEIDVDLWLDAMTLWESVLSQKLNADFKRTYQLLAKKANAMINPIEAGNRALKNQCLYYLSRDDEGLEFARKQQQEALCMTDELAAFKLLCERDNVYFNKASDDFYQKWQAEHLVLDKWFSVRASAKHENIFKDIETLSQDKHFSKGNPNKVRALIASFVKLNPKSFHQKDGKGYELLANWVIDLDSQNPQLASGLVGELTLFKRYDKKRQALMKARLQVIMEKEGLSSNVYEKVSKALI